MAGAKYATGDDPAKFLGVNTYFTQDEGQWVKKIAVGASHSVTGLKADLEGAKAAIAGVALGLTLFKADFTAFKIDEKGISFLGRQKFIWPHARDDEERGDRKLEAKVLRAESAFRTAERRYETAADTLRLANRTAAAANSSPGGAGGNLSTSAKLLTDQAVRAEKLAREAYTEAEKQKKKLDRTLQAIQEQKRKADSEEKQVERAKKETDESVKKITSSLEGLKQRQNELKNSVRQLSESLG
ncbi:hypothetical protein [Streptomyces brasiliscabiei]|uniref:hypothetical protein n=1 Tax=Streptomyces brasiliscabiei TaxID=2736302 RepID=UPI001C0F99C0|nr:hypothetical protein [Streptomyces brasiliscabiei]